MTLVDRYNNYHATRFTQDARRRVLWETLVRYCFQKYVPSEGSVLELGAGYCDFINLITAKRKYALDIWPGFAAHANGGVTTIVGGLEEIEQIDEGGVDLMFASNLFEHVTKDAFSRFLAVARRKLKANGRLIILQPNYKFCAQDYFDDYTHITVWSHISMCDFLRAHGYSIERCAPRFLPLTIKSRLPVFSVLIRAYLLLPYRPLGKQMLVVAKRQEGKE